MSDYTIESMEVTPYFDLENILRTAEESRVGGAALERLMRLWEEWLPLLKVRVINTGKTKYLAVWLPEAVEEAIDNAWAASPSQAYMDNALAQSLCMAAVHGLMPEVEDSGCAPAPRPTDTLRAALTAEGMAYKGDGPALARRYAVVSHYPFKGGCEICHLQSQCPKGQGQAGASSVVLPGYERS